MKASPLIGSTPSSTCKRGKLPLAPFEAISLKSDQNLKDTFAFSVWTLTSMPLSSKFEKSW